MGCLYGACHSAAPLNGVADAADFVGVALDDGARQSFDSLGKISHNRSVDLPYGGLRHELSKLRKNFVADNGIARIEQRGHRAAISARRAVCEVPQE